jgi:hypothetical protein
VIVALRVLLLAVAAAAVVAAVALGRAGRQTDQAAMAVRYACPMHPEVRAGAPGECPICRMALQRVGRPPAAAARAAAVENADFAAVENVRRHNIVDFVRRRSLLVPSRELRGPATVGAEDDVSALFYEDEIAALDDAEPGTFTLTAAPSVAIPLRRVAGPPERWDRSTARIHFRPVSGRQGPRLFAGQAGWVELAPRPRQVLAVPASAVVQSPDGPYVLAWTGADFNFDKRPIEIGETFLKQGLVVVLSGLRVNERVVGRATFFIEADRRANASAAATGWSRL